MKQERDCRRFLDGVESRVTTVVRLILLLIGVAFVLGFWVLVYYAFISWGL